MQNKLKIINLETIDSTNNYAIKLAEEKKEKEIVIIKARMQTKGRGRFNRSWLSPKDKGLYVSFLFRPKNKTIEDIFFFPLFFSFAILKTIDNIIKAEIKFPNDVVVNNKKIAGVLVETKCYNTKVDFVVVGIGINVNSNKNELLDSATSLYLETNEIYNIDELFKKLTYNVLDIYKKFKDNINLVFEELEKNNISLDDFKLVNRKKEGLKFL